jgi:hypothetical protein
VNGVLRVVGRLAQPLVRIIMSRYAKT